jgi:cytoskeletal protein CcmA (bactofilin family)
MRLTTTTRRVGALLLATVLVLSVFPGAALAQQSTSERVGGTVVVGPGETVDGDLEAVGGTVIVEGTVDGDLEATGGSVVISGRVTGDVEVVGGSITIEGVVDGSVEAAGGSVVVREGARVGSLDAAAGDVRVAGTVDGNARLAGERVELTPSASIGGNVEHDAEEFVRAPGASVGGSVTRNDDISVSATPWTGPVDFPFPAGGGVSLPTGLFAAWGLVVNLVLGAVLLLVAPGFSRSVTELGTRRPARSGAFGLLTLVGVPILLVLLLVTVVGIPLSLLGAVVFAVLLWVTFVYGALVAGTWLASLADNENRWGALLVGLLAAAILGFVPVLGGLVQFALLVVGTGAFVLALRGEEAGEEAPPADETGGPQTA